MQARPAEAQSATIWFDYCDLVQYFTDNRLPTGIQRVQIGLFRASLARDSAVAAGRIAACSFDPARRAWVALPEALFAQVCRAACASGPGGAGDAEFWRGLTGALREALATGPAAPFAPGDVLVNLGTSWWAADYLRHIAFMQRERGLLYAPFVHDCIPLCVPETCAAPLVEQFRSWFEPAMRLADLVFANSAHTARDVVRCAPRRAGGPAVDPRVVRLDARFDEGPQPSTAATARLEATAHARLGISGPFALFVATIEARKDHLFVFQCWKTLIEQHGDAVPDLICVGKEGWLVEYTLNWLRVHPQLARRIRLVGTVSDTDLAALYRTAAFTVYGSRYEGWGLPVTESLCHGRVPLVPRHSSLPEAGGPFALYYEPGSEDSFRQGVLRLLDTRERARLEAAIRARYRPRGWGDVLAQIVGTARDAARRPRPPAQAPLLRPGMPHAIGRVPQSSRHGMLAVTGDDLRYGPGWWQAESWGCWTREEQASLLFRLPRRARADQLYLLLSGGPADQVVGVQVGGGRVESLSLAAGKRRLVRLDLGPDASAGEVLVTLHAKPYSLRPFTDGGDPREIGCGLELVAVVDRRDAATRLDLLEYAQASP